MVLKLPRRISSGLRWLEAGGLTVAVMDLKVLPFPLRAESRLDGISKKKGSSRDSGLETSE